MDAAAQRHIDGAIQEYLAKVAAAIEQDARRFVPVDTGELRDSVHAEQPRGNRVRVVATAEHASYVEEGTRHMAARPFLKPALYRQRGATP